MIERGDANSMFDFFIKTMQINNIMKKVSWKYPLDDTRSPETHETHETHETPESKGSNKIMSILLFLLLLVFLIFFLN